MTTNNQPTCADRIAEHLKSRETYVDALHERINDNDQDKSEEAQEELDNLPLEVSTTVTMTVLLSTGGPADYLTAIIERTKYGWERSSDVTYHFADWFDHASTTVDDDSPLVTLFDSYVELQPIEGDR